QGQAQPIGEPVGHAEVERVDVEVQRLPERRSGLVRLRADIPLVSREATVRHADLPLARPDEAVSLSAQTGGCEAHRHSALPERPAPATRRRCPSAPAPYAPAPPRTRLRTAAATGSPCARVPPGPPGADREPRTRTLRPPPWAPNSAAGRSSRTATARCPSGP